jgi:bacterioferritin-associated ferredoxin
MIVCSCNVLSDQEVRTAVNAAAPSSAAHVHRCLGCSAQCGRCLCTIRKIMDEALSKAPVARPGAPVPRTHYLAIDSR